MGVDPTQNLGWDGLGKTHENKGTFGIAKTSFNTKEERNDDEAFAGLFETFRQITTELTGKSPMASEDVKWRELAEVLVVELRIAAGRTTVSSVPAFLAEHLRRRLWKVDKKRATEIATVEMEQGSHPALSDEEKRSCPDCAGTNFWYPEGPDKGVAKCKHSKLTTSKLDFIHFDL